MPVWHCAIARLFYFFMSLLILPRLIEVLVVHMHVRESLIPNMRQAIVATNGEQSRAESGVMKRPVTSDVT